MRMRLLSVSPRLRDSMREVANRLYELAPTMTGRFIGDHANARALIREPEHALNGGSAWLTYAEARDHRKGYPTSERLEFRWTQVQRIAADILAGVERG